jgi:hypothetical protein
MAAFSPTMTGGSSKFNDPFLLPSSETFPSDVRGTMDLCLYLYNLNKIYGAIANRVVSYFITDLKFDGESNKKERDALSDVLINMLGIFSKMQQAGHEWAVYGNGFIRCVEPFDRYLIDDRNGGYKAIAISAYPEHLVTYNWADLTYTVPDLTVAKNMSRKKRKLGNLPKVTLKFRDKPAAAPDRFSIIFLDPRFITLDKAHHSDSVQYIYTIPPDMESRIKNGVMHEINSTPRGLLEAVAANKDYRYHKGEVYHFKAPTVTGVSDSGWGLPEIISNYHSIYQLQIYRKADFAIAQDYVHPFRVFTPNFGDSVGDSVVTLLMGQWQSEMKRMIAARRRDGTAIHALPFKADYNEYGGNGKQMVLHEVVEAYTDALFDGMGFPRELFRGSMNTDQLPNAIRMFERHYEWLYHALNGLLEFVADTVQRAMDTDAIKVRLKRPVMAYTAEWMQLKMQLAANREIPRADVYPDIGVSDAEGAAVLAAMEDQEIQRRTGELAAKFEKEKTQGSMADVAIMAAEQSAGAPPPPGGAGGAPPAGGPGGQYAVDTGADPLQITQRAQEIAAQWIQMHAQQPNSHRKEMQMCEATNPTLYASAKQEMEKMRSQGASQGRASVAQNLAPPAA